MVGEPTRKPPGASSRAAGRIWVAVVGETIVSRHLTGSVGAKRPRVYRRGRSWPRGRPWAQGRRARRRTVPKAPTQGGVSHRVGSARRTPSRVGARKFDVTRPIWCSLNRVPARGCHSDGAPTGVPVALMSSFSLLPPAWGGGRQQRRWAGGPCQVLVWSYTPAQETLRKNVRAVPGDRLWLADGHQGRQGRGGPASSYQKKGCFFFFYYSASFFSRHTTPLCARAPRSTGGRATNLRS